MALRWPDIEVSERRYFILYNKITYFVNILYCLSPILTIVILYYAYVAMWSTDYLHICQKRRW